MTTPTTPDPNSRRGFMRRVLAVGAGAIAALAPLGAALAVFLDPLGKKAGGGKFVRVGSLSAVPPDGKPYRFEVIADRWDAWNYYPPAPIGAVYLRRTSDSAPPEAFSTVCPHLGCSVDFRSATGQYLCPCHNSAFEVDGTRVDPAHSPSPRDLDTLAVEVRDGDEIWIEYKRFKGGVAAKIEE